jgi:cAMP phosphodiesterase
MEGAKQDFSNKSVIIRNQGSDNAYTDYAAMEGLREDLEDLYLVQDSSLTEQTGKAEELAKKYNVTTDKIWSAALALEQSKDEIEDIALETENIARANLTAMASGEV